jgi:hypothetical protein
VNGTAPNTELLVGRIVVVRGYKPITVPSVLSWRSDRARRLQANSRFSSASYSSPNRRETLGKEEKVVRVQIQRSSEPSEVYYVNTCQHVHLD